MTYMATPSHKNPCPRGHEIYNFGRPFLGHHYYILGLSDLCLGVEKKILKEIMHFYCMTYMATHQHKNPSPRSHEIYNFGRPFLGHLYYILCLSDPCPTVDKKSGKILHFHDMAMRQHKLMTLSGTHPRQDCVFQAQKFGCGNFLSIMKLIEQLFKTT